MIAVLIRRGLLDRRRALLTWSLSLGATGAFFMAIWPSVEDSIGEVAENYPAGLKEAFGIGALSNAQEYLNAELFSLILPVAIGLLALRTVAAAIDGAQERGYLDGLAAAGYANVWPLAIFTAGVAMVVTGVSQHAATVTGVAAGTLVGMYVLDLMGKLADSIEPVRWLSVFRYYGSAGIDGIDPVAFAGVTLAGVALAVAGTLLFERRDLSA